MHNIIVLNYGFKFDLNNRDGQLASEPCFQVKETWIQIINVKCYFAKLWLIF